MPSRSEAEEHLRVIRFLMERATLYRAITAPAAAVGGLLALLATAILPHLGEVEINASTQASPSSAAQFLSLWGGILGITLATNFRFLWLEARRRGAPFWSPGMRLALQAVLPSYLLAAVATSFGGSVLSPADFARFAIPIWIICHGLALLATSHFAPRSLLLLGWGFLFAGMAAAANAYYGGFAVRFWMAATFGLFHLIYAACAWIKRPSPAPETVVSA